MTWASAFTTVSCVFMCLAATCWGLWLMHIHKWK